LEGEEPRLGHLPTIVINHLYTYTNWDDPPSTHIICAFFAIKPGLDKPVATFLLFYTKNHPEFCNKNVANKQIITKMHFSSIPM